MTETSAVQVPSPRTEDPLLERSCRAYLRSWAAMALACPGGSYDEAEGVVRARTQLPVPAFNGVWPGAREVSADAVLAAVDEFAGGALPWNLQLRPGYPAELEAELAERGLVPTARIPFMVLTDPARAQAVVDAAGDRRVRPMVTFVDVSSVVSLLEQGFSMPPALTRGLFPMRMLMLPGTATWIVADGGEDVSTAFGAVEEGCCGIYNVATPEQHRGRGHGALATAQAVLHGYEQGAASAYLQSSPMGYPVYERLGFTTAERWQQWMPAEYVT
jgi:hypothetical protein